MINNYVRYLLLVISIFGYQFLLSSCNDSVKLDAGQWQGNPSVSFTVDAEKVIHDFKISVPLAMGKCDLEIPLMRLSGSGKIDIKHPKEYFSISGEVTTPSAITGKVNIKICPDPEDKNNVVMLVPWEKEWKADLVK